MLYGDMSTKKSIEIGVNHRRIISITLTMLDEFLCRCERFAQGRDVQSVFYIENNTLTPEQRARLESAIAVMRAELKEIRDTLNLQVSRKQIVNSIWAECHLLWESLIEIKGKYLRGYGVPPEDLVNYIDPKSERLIALVNEIITAVSPADFAPKNDGCGQHAHERKHVE